MSHTLVPGYGHLVLFGFLDRWFDPQVPHGVSGYVGPDQLFYHVQQPLIAPQV